jgi:AraC-like DNA-binding protein
MPKSPKPNEQPTQRAQVEARALDVLSDVLGMLRLRGEVMCRNEFSAPFGVSYDSDQAHFHVIERGTCLVRYGENETLKVSGGDLLVLPHGRGHALLDAAGSRVVSLKSILDPRRKRPTGVLRFGGGGAQTDVICGHFRFDTRLRASMLAGLPPILHVRGTNGRPPEWLELTVRYLAAETRSTEPGRELAMSRLVDLLFVQTLRHWLVNSPTQPLGWLGALRDPRVGAALTLVHTSPERPWDVASLAAEVGMSRSSFATRFVELVGEPPSKYLTRWRVHVASRLLRTPGPTIAQTAERVGYDSEAAFSRMFKRYVRIAPAAFREEHMDSLLSAAPQNGAGIPPRVQRRGDARTGVRR